MPFRRHIPMGEMRETAAQKPDQDRHETTYQASRGGWHRDNKPHQDKKDKKEGRR